MVKAVNGEVECELSAEAANAAKAAAAIMGMNDVHWLATQLIPNEAYATLPAKLRMNVIGASSERRASTTHISSASPRRCRP